MSYAAVPRTPQPPLTSSMVRADRGSLTESELLVLRLVCIEGMSHQQISRMRHRSHKTSETHLWKAKQKLGAKSSYQLGYLAGQLFTTKDPS